MDIPISAYNAYLHMIEVHPPTLQGEEKRFKHKRKHDFITPSEDDESKIDNKTHRQTKNFKKQKLLPRDQANT